MNPDASIPTNIFLTFVRMMNELIYIYAINMAYMSMSLKSTVGVAKVGTRSLRATVPGGIVVYLEIDVGDKLEWKMDMKDEERVAIVRKAKHG